MLGAVLFVEREERLLGRALHQLRHILTIGLDGTLEVFSPLLGVGIAVPAHGGDEGLDLKEVGIGQQPHHRLVVVWLDISGRNVCTHHETGLESCLTLRQQR